MPPLLFKTLKTIRPERKSESVIRQMRLGISTGELAPGSRLPSEPVLAESFGVSRSVIREAMRVLETGGYLDIRRGSAGGTFIAERVPDEFKPSRTESDMPAFDDRQLYDARRAIALPLIRGARFRTPRDQFDLITALARLDNEATSPARLTLALTDVHATLAAIGNNPLLAHLLERMTTPIRSAIAPRVRDPRWIAASRLRLRDLARAIEQAAPSEAEALMTAQLAAEHGMTG